MRTGVSLWVFALALLVLAPVAARAQSDDDWRYYPSAGNGAEPLDRILPEIRRSHPGRFYDAEGPFMGGDGQMHYRVKWMTPEGRIVWLDTDARTGRVLGSGGGRHDYGNENSYSRDQGYDDRRGNRSDERRNHFTDDNFGDRPDRGGRDWNGGDQPDRSGRDLNGGGRDWGGGDRPDRGGGDRQDRGGGDRPDRGGRQWNGGWGAPWGDHHGHHQD